MSLLSRLYSCWIAGSNDGTQPAYASSPRRRAAAAGGEAMAKHRSRISSESSDTAGERSAGRPPVDRGMTVPSPSTGRAREKRADPANGSVPIRSTDPQAAVQTAPTPVATVLESGNLDFF